jgi:hypothetical protein
VSERKRFPPEGGHISQESRVNSHRIYNQISKPDGSTAITKESNGKLISLSLSLSPIENGKHDGDGKFEIFTKPEAQIPNPSECPLNYKTLLYQARTRTISLFVRHERTFRSVSAPEAKQQPGVQEGEACVQLQRFVPGKTSIGKAKVRGRRGPNHLRGPLHRAIQAPVQDFGSFPSHAPSFLLPQIPAPPPLV